LENLKKREEADGLGEEAAQTIDKKNILNSRKPVSCAHLFRLNLIEMKIV
jgi:hypothetical protein